MGLNRRGSPGTGGISGAAGALETIGAFLELAKKNDNSCKCASYWHRTYGRQQRLLVAQALQLAACSRGTHKTLRFVERTAFSAEASHGATASATTSGMGQGSKGRTVRQGFPGF